MPELNREENSSTNWLGRSYAINNWVGYILVNYVVCRDEEVDGRYPVRLKFDRVTSSDLAGNRMNL